MIGELDLVVLKRDLPNERLAAGDVGTVVLVHQQGAGYEVEFTTLSGDTVAVLTLDASDVRLAEAREIVHARAVSESAELNSLAGKSRRRQTGTRRLDPLS